MLEGVLYVTILPYIGNWMIKECIELLQDSFVVHIAWVCTPSLSNVHATDKYIDKVYLLMHLQIVLCHNLLVSKHNMTCHVMFLDEFLWTTMHQLHQWEASAALQPHHVHLGTRRISERGYSVDIHWFRTWLTANYWPAWESEFSEIFSYYWS